MPSVPEVSIIVPCFRAWATIPETVAGVLAQTFTDWELILVSDDGGDYPAYLAARGIDDARIRQHPVKTIAAGHVCARNRGLAMAQGAVIADLDADDIWRPARLERLLPLAREHGAAQDILECFDADGTLGFSGEVDGKCRRLSAGQVTGIDFPFHLLVRRDLMADFWFDEDLSAPDAIRAAIFAARSPIALLGEALLRYRVHSQSMSQSPKADRKMDLAYRQILTRLTSGDGYGLTGDDLEQAIAGFRRKQMLNLRHLRQQRRDPKTPPFITWRLRDPNARIRQ